MPINRLTRTPDPIGVSAEKWKAFGKTVLHLSEAYSGYTLIQAHLDRVIATTFSE